MRIKIDEKKAAEITKQRVRAWREAEFKKNDIKLQNAIVDGDEAAKSEAIKRRDELRDMPEKCEGRSVKELKEILEKHG